MFMLDSRVRLYVPAEVGHFSNTAVSGMSGRVRTHSCIISLLLKEKFTMTLLQEESGFNDKETVIL